MNQKAYLVALPVTLFTVMALFLSAIIFVNPNSASAASDKAKTKTVAKLSAVEHTEARIKELKSTLKITEGQEALWNNLTLVMRDNAKEMDAFTKERAESSKTMNAVEHMKIHSQITELQLNQQKKFIPPFEALYTSMSDEQKKITDTIFRTGKHGKHTFK